MNRFDATAMFVGALREHGSEFYYSPWCFAHAVDLLPDNAVAKQYLTLNGVAGRDSPDFREALTVAQSACLLYFVSPAFNTFEIQISPRITKHFLKGPHVEDARELAKGYVDQLTEKRPWA